MSETLGALVDRTIRDWLQPPDDQPIRMTLSGALTTSATSLTYAQTTLLAEEEFLLGPGTLIEIGQEQMLLGTVNDSTNTVTDLVRGVNGTPKTTHAIGDVITVKPTWGRRSVFDALSSAIVGLYPRIYRRRAATVTVQSGYTEIPEDAEIPESFIWFDGGVPRFPRIRLIDVPTIGTGRAMLTLDAPPGTQGTLVYRGRFPMAQSEADDLVEDLGVLPEYHNVIQTRAVAHIIAGRDMDRFTMEYLTQQIGSQVAGEVPSGNQLRDALLRYYEYQMNELSRNAEAVQFHNGWTRGA